MHAVIPVALCAIFSAATPSRAADLILDDSQAELSGDWEVFSSPACYGGTAVRTARGSGGSTATFRTDLDEGIYEVSLRWPGGDGTWASSLPVFVRAADHTRHTRVDLRAGGGAWQSIGEYRLGAGGDAAVVITDMGDGAAVADAVRCVWKCAVPAAGRTYYVAPGGSNTGPGTAGSPWATLQKAAAALDAGDTVYAREGVYAGGVTPLRTGSDHRYLSFRAYPGETPVVKGGPGHGFDLSGKSWIRIEGFRVEGNAGNGIHLGASAHDVEILDCELTGNGGGNPWNAGMMILEGCAQVYARGCRAHENTGFGFASDHDNPRAAFVTLERCEAWKNGNDGFGFYAERAYLTECVSHENGWNVTGNGDDFDFLHSRDVILDRCASWGSNAHFYKLGDGYNIVVNCASADTQQSGYGRYPGIAFLGADSSGFAANCSVRGISMSGAGPYAIRNCIIRKNGNSSAISAAIYCESAAAGLFSDYNLFLPDVRYGVSFDPLCHRGSDPGGVSYHSLAEWQAAGYDAHSTTAVESPYADEAALDFRLKAGGAAIDAGTSDGTPVSDFSGCGRRWNLPPARAGAGSRPYHDKGAIEYRGGECAPPIRVTGNGTSFPRGARLTIGASVQPTTRPFDAYAVLAGPGGTFSVRPGGGMVEGIRPYAARVPSLGDALEAALLDIAIPAGTPAGAWVVYAGLVPPGAKPSPRNAFALDSVRITVKD